MSDSKVHHLIAANLDLVVSASKRQRGKRKPNLASELKQADKAGKPVKAATITPDSITLTFGQPEAEPPTNDLDKWDGKTSCELGSRD